MIKIDIESKKYKNNIVLENTSAIFENNKIYAIKGESGIGKSTLLKMIGLIEQFNGIISIDDIVVTKKNSEKLRCDNFAYLFQKPYLLPYLNVKDNLLYGAKKLRLQYDNDFFNDVVNLLKISDLLERNPKNLSGGEASRVALGRAILSKRKVILADEPTASLDENNALAVMNLLKELQRKYSLTIIVVSHTKEYDDIYDCIYKIDVKRILEQ